MSPSEHLPEEAWRVMVDQDRQATARILSRIEGKLDAVRADALATRRHVTAQTYVGARAPVPLILSVAALVWAAVLSAVMVAGCQRSPVEAWREGGAPARHVLAGESP
jgi:hypothetical protein